MTSFLEYESISKENISIRLGGVIEGMIISEEEEIKGKMIINNQRNKIAKSIESKAINILSVEGKSKAKSDSSPKLKLLNSDDFHSLAEKLFYSYNPAILKQQKH